MKAFARIFQNRRHTSAFIVVSWLTGFEVIRLDADNYVARPVAVFPVKEYGDSWAPCRDAADAFARAKAREEK